MKRYPARISVKLCNNKYLRRSIRINGKVFCYARWLFEKEVRPLKPGEIVHHKDENTLNDSIKNLKAMPIEKHASLHNKNKKRPMKEETKIKISISNKGKKRSKETKLKMSKAQTGENHNFAKLSQKEVDEIRYIYYNDNISQSNIAKLYGVSRSCIKSIITGTNWNPNKLTKEQLIENSKFIFEKPALNKAKAKVKIITKSKKKTKKKIVRKPT
jgi:predicted DNA-binding protein YlxM (UPF0122 family)